MYEEEDYLLLSGIQHFSFCRRQWALIHIEQLWEENLRTTEGQLLHERVHDPAQTELRGTIYTVRGMRVHSPTLGVSGECDAVEFRKDPGGIPLAGKEGLWQPFPIEYKRGEPKDGNCDAVQLCAQAMCLEEMLCCKIPCGALYYGQTRHRENVTFSPELREEVQTTLAEMHQLFQRGFTPLVKPAKRCNACSMKELCLPVLAKNKSVNDYLAAAMEEMP